MKRLLVFSLLFVTLFCFAVSQFIPTEFDSIFMARNNGKYYDEAKKLGLVKILTIELGLEPMIQGLIASYAAQYGVTVKDIDDLLTKDLLVVQIKEDVFAAIGPSASASKFTKVVSSLLGESFFVDHKNNYLLVSTSKDLLDKCSKGGGSVPKEVTELLQDSKVWAVTYSPSIQTGDSLFMLKGFVKVLDDQIYSEQILLPKNEAAKQVLKQLTPSRNFELRNDKNLSGEAFAFLNVSDPTATSNLLDLSENLPQFAELGEISELDPTEYLEKIEKLLGKFTGKAALSIQLAEAVESLFASDQEVSLSVKTYGVASMKTTLQELKEILGGEIKTSGEIQYLDVDGLCFTVDSSLVRFYSAPPAEYKVGRSSLDKALNLFKPDEMFFFAFVDFDPILDKLLGITTGSIFVLFQAVENNLLKTIWYLK